MNKDILNMEIRKFLKKFGISSHQFLEKQINDAEKKGIIKAGQEIEVEMEVRISNFQSKNTIKDKIILE